MAKYSLVMMGALSHIMSIWPMYSASVHLLIYLHSWLCAHKTGNISETVDDKAQVTINGLYKIVHGLSFFAKMYDLE